MRLMATLIDHSEKIEVRHPEKQRRPDAPIQRKPEWIRVRAPVSKGYQQTREIVRSKNLTTVCEEAACPNIGECWDKKHATMMIMGDTCTRACAFCNVRTGMPAALDPKEPANVADAVAEMDLAHVVITSVDRDDLGDGGAEHFADTVREIQVRAPQSTIEILTPDFLRKEGAVEVVIDSKPDVFNHNLETVPRLYLSIRPMRSANIDFITIGQYLQPTKKHAAIDRFVTPDEFKAYETIARSKGFLMVSSSPLTRSSHHAGEDFARLKKARVQKEK